MIQTVAASKQSPEWHENRRRLGWAVASANGTISEFARRCGRSFSTAQKWLLRYDQELHRALLDGCHMNTLPREDRLERLRICQEVFAEGHGQREAAKRCGISQMRLSIWLRKWAPDGIEQAIEDESFEDETDADAYDSDDYGCNDREA